MLFHEHPFAIDAFTSVFSVPSVTKICPMNRKTKSTLFWFSALAVTLSCAPLLAQETAPDAAAEQLAPETNPAVLAALELPRTEPRHYVSAILSLVELDRPELAKPILDQLEALKLSDAQRAALVQEFGTQRMLRLARTPALAPAGGEFADACLAAAAAAARDPQQLAQLIAQLSDASPSARHAAQVDLASAGQDAVVAMLEALAQEKDPQRRCVLVEAVAQMGPAAIGPLLGILVEGRNQAEFGSDLIHILQAIDVSQAVPLIAAHSHSPDAERLLVDATRSLATRRAGLRPRREQRSRLMVVVQGPSGGQSRSGRRSTDGLDGPTRAGTGQVTAGQSRVSAASLGARARS